MTKISFVIPAHNEERYIGDSIRSILTETRQAPYDTEIVVVNNASTDRTREIALSFSGVRVVDEPQKGLTHARQAGFLASSGDFIAHLDADTLLPSGWIEAALREFERHPDIVALSSGPLVFYDAPSAVNFLIRSYYYGAYALYVMSRFALRTGSVLQGGNAMIRRFALEKIGGYNLNYRFYGEDTDLARRLSKIGGVKYTLKFPVYTSGRRISAEGLVAMGAKYALNYFWAAFLQKPFTKTAAEIPYRKKHHA